MTRKQHLATETYEVVLIHCKVLGILSLLAKSWNFAVNTQIAWIGMMTSSAVTSPN